MNQKIFQLILMKDFNKLDIILPILLISFSLVSFNLVDGARSFDGATDYIATGDNSGYTISSGDITITAWILQDSLTASKTEIVWKSTSETTRSDNYHFRIYETGKLDFGYKNNADTGWHSYASNSQEINAGNWQHIAITYTYGSGSSAKLYVNGTEVDASWVDGDGTETPITGTQHLTIGVAHKGDTSSAINWWNGDIEDVAIFTTILTPQDISDLYDGTKNSLTVSQNNIIAYLPLNTDITEDNTISDVTNKTMGIFTTTATLTDGIDGNLIRGMIPQEIPEGLIIENKIKDILVALGSDHEVTIREIGNLVTDLTDIDKPYKFYYTGKDGGHKTINMAYTTDLDGVWTKFSGNPIIDNRTNSIRIEDPFVYVDSDGDYHMMTEYYANTSTLRIAYFNSTDSGETWTIQTSQYIPKGTGWESYFTASPVYYANATHLNILYEGALDTGGVPLASIGLATVPIDKPFSTPTKYAGNPIYNSTSGFDSQQNVPDDIRLIDGTLFMLQHGTDGNGSWYDGLLSSTKITGTWKEQPFPITTRNGAMFYGNNTHILSQINTTAISIYSILGYATFPDPPTSLTATSVSTTQINLSWTAPIDDGGSAVTGYKIEFESPSGAGFSTLVADTGDTSTTYSHTLLTANTQYNYKVTAINTIENSSPSNEASDTTTSSSSSDTSLQSSGATTEPIEIDLISRIFTLSFISQNNNIGLGKINTFDYELIWNYEASPTLKITNIDVNHDNLNGIKIIPHQINDKRITVLNPLFIASPQVLAEIPDDKIPTSNMIKYTVDVPEQECGDPTKPISTSRCVNIGEYTIPFKLTLVTETGNVYVQEINTIVQVGSLFDVSTIATTIIAIVVGGVIIHIMRKKSRNSSNGKSNEKRKISTK